MSRALAAEPGRKAKVALLAGLLQGLGREDLRAAVGLLSGESKRMRVGVGPAALRDLPPPADTAELGVAEAEAALRAIARVHGAGAQAERRRLLADLFARATAEEQALLSGVLVGDLRQGALDAVMGDAVAAAAGVPAAEVRRALMFRDSAAEVAAAAMDGGADALRAFGLELGHPFRPMLAASAPDVGAALERLRPAALEWKLDGIRVQVHRDGDRVSVHTRSLDDITARVPEVVEAARALPLCSAVLDGEALALAADGRPLPFQVTAARTASRQDVAVLRAEVPLSVFFFDLLHRDGVDLLDQPEARRFAELAAVVPPELRVPRLVTGDDQAARAFFDDALAHGHEGVVAKDPDSRYTAGRRGAGWIKVKPRHTLDLVVLAAEWGSGRRRGAAEQPAPRGPRRRHTGAGGVGDARQDLQGPHRRNPGLPDPGTAGAGGRPGRLGGAGPAGARRRDRLRRRAAQPPLSGRADPALRPGAALPPGQACRRGRLDRRRPPAGRAGSTVDCGQSPEWEPEVTQCQYQGASSRSSASSSEMAALISARWVNACGKFPSCSPVGPISSANRPTWLA